MRKLINEYTALLEKAEKAIDRKEAFKLIRQSTKLREQMVNYSGLL